jgi:hypothetical protein
VRRRPAAPRPPPAAHHHIPPPAAHLSVSTSPAPADGAPLAGPDDWVALRDQPTIEARNCSAIEPGEVRRVSARGTIATPPWPVGSVHHLCLGRRADVGDAPPAGTTAWAAGFVWQRLVRLGTTWAIGVGSDGVYSREGLALRAQADGLAEATSSGVLEVGAPGVPMRLALDGPAEGAAEVRDVPLAAQPVVRVVGVHG